MKVTIFLADARNRKRMSTRELSRASGVARSYISKIEAGEANPSIETMCRLAAALDVPVTSLFSYKKEVFRGSDGNGL